MGNPVLISGGDDNGGDDNLQWIKKHDNMLTQLRVLQVRFLRESLTNLMRFHAQKKEQTRKKM